METRLEGAKFGLLNWLVLFAYLSVLVTIGWRCSIKERTIENFFLGLMGLLGGTLAGIATLVMVSAIGACRFSNCPGQQATSSPRILIGNQSFLWRTTSASKSAERNCNS